MIYFLQLVRVRYGLATTGSEQDGSCAQQAHDMRDKYTIFTSTGVQLPWICGRERPAVVRMCHTIVALSRL